MSDRGWMEPIVERVVGQVVESHASQLRREIVRRVTDEIASQPGSGRVFGSGAATLARAVADIQLGTSQREILHTLLESSSCCAARIALFVVKAGGATGWQARGFASSAAMKDFALDAAAPAVQRAIGDRTASSATGAEFDPRFLAQFGAPTGEARLLPLILKDKVAALVYADGGPDGALLDTCALELLVLSASAWLEVNALRKQIHKEGAAASVPAAAAGEAVAAPALAIRSRHKLLRTRWLPRHPVLRAQTKRLRLRAPPRSLERRRARQLNCILRPSRPPPCRRHLRLPPTCKAQARPELHRLSHRPQRRRTRHSRCQRTIRRSTKRRAALPACWSMR